MSKTGYSWTDANQATDRVHNTYLLHNERLCWISDVRGSHLRLQYQHGKRESVEVPLNDKGFEGFSKLPPLGYCNVAVEGAPLALFARRIPVRSRKHGLTRDNVSVSTLRSSGHRTGEYSALNYFADPGYDSKLKGEFPTIEEALTRLPADCSVAVGHRLAISSDSGLFWLWRDQVRLGILSKGSLSLFPKVSFLRETLENTDELKGLELKELV